MGMSRRQWIQAAGLVATAAATPMLAEAKATAPANLSLNENPWGPSAAAVRAMQAKVGPSTTGVYICNPNNPTSTMVDTERLKAFAAEVSKTAPVFIDEAYIDMTDAWPNNTMAPLVREGRNVIVCRTFSKLHGLAGQRVGYAIMPAEIASAIRRDVSGGGMNRIGIAAATASYQDTAFATEMRLRLIRGRQMMTAMADRLGLTYAPDPQANFIYVRTGMPNRDFVEKMEGQGVLVVRRGFPGHDDWNRICVGADTELAACETALKRVLA